MKDLGFGLVDQRTVIVVLMTALVSHLLLGFAFPIETQSLLSLFIDLFLLTGYLYLVRTFIRLPFAIGIGFRDALRIKDDNEYRYYKYKEHLLNALEDVETTIGRQRYERTSRFWRFVASVHLTLGMASANALALGDVRLRLTRPICAHPKQFSTP
jgi:hypothetical protein